MENYLVDRETLAQFIDQLTSQKPLPATTPEERNQQREQLISSLDQTIRLSLLNQLSADQLDELNSLLDRDDEITDEYDRFFDHAGLDLHKITTNAAVHFGQVYLGGAHA